MECNINDCPRNELGECELSKLPKSYSYYNDPTRCAHNKFVNRKE